MLAPERLELWQQQTLQPVVSALARNYFRQPATEPICVVLAADPAVYRRYAKQLSASGGEPVFSRGFYQPHLRLIVVAAGDDAAFRHELTHALMDFDFPAAPAWLREGLAALHEEIAWEGDPQRMVGHPGPRLETLQSALRERRGETLEALWRRASLHGRDEAVLYATARYFCLYLQRRGVLDRVYREVRENAAADPTGSRAVCGALKVSDGVQLEAEFRAFVLQLVPPADRRDR